MIAKATMKNKLAAILFVLVALFCTNGEARFCDLPVGDDQHVTDIVTHAGSGSISSSHDVWGPSDVSKQIIIHDSTSIITALTTIASVTDSKHAVTTGHAIANTSGSIADWFTTDLQTLMNDQVAACLAGPGLYPTTFDYYGADAGTVRLDGKYFSSGCIYNVQTAGVIPSIEGSGRYNTVIFTGPTMSSCGDGPQLIFARGAGLTIKNLTIDGGNFLYPSGGLISVFQSRQVTLSDVALLHWGTSDSHGVALTVVDTADISITNSLIQEAPTGDMSFACEFGGTGVITNTFCSNHRRNLHIKSNRSRTSGSMGLAWVGGGADECIDPNHWCTFVDDNAEFQITGQATFFSTIKVGAGSVLRLRDSNVGFYNSGDRGLAIQIDATGQVFASGSTLRGNNGGASVVNYNPKGFIDMGGNDYKSCFGFVCTSRSAPKAFTGFLPISGIVPSL